MTTVLTPREVVRELDRYIIGQDEAKRMVAIALRNRYRRSQVSEEMRDEIYPKNILMMGPTSPSRARSRTSRARCAAKHSGVNCGASRRSRCSPSCSWRRS